MTPSVESVDSLYDATCQKTLARWADHDGTGDKVEPPFHPTKLSLTTGNFSGFHPPLQGVLTQIRHLVGADPRADILGAESLHFTFLALSQPDYAGVDDLPDLADVQRIFARRCERQCFALRALRLVALPNALLVAGSPDPLTASRRAAFTQDLLASSWSDRLRARYPTGPLPPAFWHSTLVRYHAEYLPDPLRRFFMLNQAARYGDVSLEIKLLATN